MRGITLTQPWATLVAIGAKTIETRPTRSHYRGPIAIHAAKGLAGLADVVGKDKPTEWDLWEFCQTNWPFRDALVAAGYKRPGSTPDNPLVETDRLPRGRIVAVVSLIDVLPTDVARRLVLDRTVVAPPSELQFGNYTPGRFAWLLDNIRPLRESVPFRGNQTMFRVPDDVASRLKLQSVTW